MGQFTPEARPGPGGGNAAIRFGECCIVSTPAEAVVSLETTVLLMKLSFNASCIDTPPPSQPATLLAMMLLVTLMPCQKNGIVGKAMTSCPLTPWKRMPPPLP